MITALMVMAMLETPRYVFKMEVDGRLNAHCYRMPSPEGTEAKFCDVISPATGQPFVVTMISQGSIAVQKGK